MIPIPGFLHKPKVTIRITDPDLTDTKLRLIRRQPIGQAEQYALQRLQALAEGDEREISPERLLDFGSHVSRFNELSEDAVVHGGWFARAPRSVIRRWVGIAVVEVVVAGLAIWGALSLPSSGLTLVGVSLGVAGAATFGVAYWMPSVTHTGAMVRAWLAAYRRTLQATLRQAQSMTEVVDKKVLPWIETPDQAVVWGVALGLHKEVEEVLHRSVEAGAPRHDDGHVVPRLVWQRFREVAARVEALAVEDSSPGPRCRRSVGCSPPSAPSATRPPARGAADSAEAARGAEEEPAAASETTLAPWRSSAGPVRTVACRKGYTALAAPGSRPRAFPPAQIGYSPGRATFPRSLPRHWRGSQGYHGAGSRCPGPHHILPIRSARPHGAAQAIRDGSERHPTVGVERGAGVAYGGRTHNLRIHNPMLCRLS